MSWVKMDDKHWRNPKALSLSDAEYRVWVNSWSRCADRPDPSPYLTTEEVVHLIRGLRKSPRIIEQLIARHAWERTEDGIRVHDLEIRVEAMTAAERKRKQRHSVTEGGTGGHEDVTADVTDASRSGHKTRDSGARARARATGTSRSPVPDTRTARDLSTPSKPPSPFSQLVAQRVEEVRGSPPSPAELEFLERIQPEAPRVTAEALADKYQVCHGRFLEGDKPAPTVTYLRQWCREENARLADQGVPVPRREAPGFASVAALLGEPREPRQ